MITIEFKFGNRKVYKRSRDARVFYFEQMPTQEEFIARVSKKWGYLDMGLVKILEIRE